MGLVRAAVVAGLAATFILGAPRDGAAQVDRADVVKTYADIGQAMYEGALARARVLQKALRALVDAPSEAALRTAREAWLSAREPYMQTEVFRFGNSVVGGEAEAATQRVIRMTREERDALVAFLSSL